MKPLILYAIAAAIMQAQPRSNDPANPLDGDPAAIEAGRKMFTGSCGGCHGATGEGGRGPNLRDGKLIRRSNDFQMSQTIRKGIPGTDMPGSNLDDNQVWQLVAFVRALGRPAAESRVPGDATKGQAVYTKAGCANCHMIGGQGGALGPDLSNAGANRSLEYLREAIVKPGERVVQGYLPVTVKLKDGRTIEGVTKNYTNYDLQITDKTGRLFLLQTSDLSDVQFRMQSLMPKDYGKRLSREEITDLLAYLSQQSMRPAKNRRGGAR